MHRWARAFFVSGLVAWAGLSGLSAGAATRTVEQRVPDADAVLIGQVSQLHPSAATDSAGRPLAMAEVRAHEIFKGSGDTWLVATPYEEAVYDRFGRASGASGGGLKAGADYVLFLKKADPEDAVYHRVQFGLDAASPEGRRAVKELEDYRRRQAFSL